MTDPIDPVRPAPNNRRQRARRLGDPAPETTAQGPARPAASVAPATAPAPPPEADPKPILAAHLMGQDGQKRDPRGGREILSKAKAAYLSTEWSGQTDRRYPPGGISKTRV